MLRGGGGFVPKADTVIEAGDEVLLILDPGLEEAITPQFARNGASAAASRSSRWPTATSTHLLIGGGLASANCARWLRESGAEGEILLVGREPDPPYNRPPCSKGYLQGKESREDTLLPPGRVVGGAADRAAHAHERDEARHGRERGDAVRRKEVVSYDSALLATGANVRRLNVDGAELEGIHYLRALGNADTIRADADGKRVVLIGGSYIGSEVAASLTAADHATCADRDAGGGDARARLRRARPAAGFQDRLEEHGIVVHGEDALERFEGADGRVTHVVTQSGLAAGGRRVVIGAGVMPDVMLARAAGLELDEERGGVAVRRAAAHERAGRVGGRRRRRVRQRRPTAGGSASSTGTSPSTTARRPR